MENEANPAGEHTPVTLPEEVIRAGVAPVHHEGIQTEEAARKASSENVRVNPAGEANVVNTEPATGSIKAVEQAIRRAERGKQTTDSSKWSVVKGLIMRSKKKF